MIISPYIAPTTSNIFQSPSTAKKVKKKKKKKDDAPSMAMVNASLQRRSARRSISPVPPSQTATAVEGAHTLLPSQAATAMQVGAEVAHTLPPSQAATAVQVDTLPHSQTATGSERAISPRPPANTVATVTSLTAEPNEEHTPVAAETLHSLSRSSPMMTYHIPHPLTSIYRMKMMICS
jgi:reverse gyrase